MKEKVTAIIPAYNEAKTIGQAITDLLHIPCIDQIVVIDDGSSDETARNIVRQVVFLRNKINRGKGYSVARGLVRARNEYILLLDADIVHWTERDVELLISPVLSGECDYTLKPTDDHIFSRLSGVRCYKKADLLPLTQEMAHTSRYGLEILLNKKLRHLSKKYVRLHDYHHFDKFEKYPLHRALWEYAKEGMSLLRQMIDF